MRSKAFLVTLLVTTVALAGCTDGDGTDGVLLDEPEMGTVVTTEENKTITFGPHSGLETSRSDDWAPTLETAPEWVLGEWWTVEITDHFIGESHTVTRIAAGKEGTNFLVGMPIDDFSDDVMILHLPGFGLVHSQSLGVEAHDFLYEPLRFPLQPGNEWNSLWEGEQRTVTHSVEATYESNMTATIQQSGAQSATYTYDANLGVITDYLAPGYMEYKVVDHGFDYEGIVRVPYSHDLTMNNGVAGAATVGNSEGAVQSYSGQCPPGVLSGCTDMTTYEETFIVEEAGATGVVYDRASFALLIFELSGFVDSSGTSQTLGNGYYSITATDPNGNTWENVKMPNEGGHKFETGFTDLPAGEWTIQIVAGGPAQVFIEGISYASFDVSLPTGCVVAGGQIHEHGGECGGHIHNLE